MTLSVKNKQSDAILSMLNLNVPDGSKNSEASWKLLIYDQRCSDIISPLIRVGKLREQGITLNMLLSADRQPIPDIPAIYFVTPSADNIKRICADCSKHLYESYYLSFSSPISPELLSVIAKSTVQSSTSHQITKIYDQNLDFISLEDNFFSIHLQNSYSTINNSQLKPYEIEDLISKIVNSVFSVITTLGVVPIIRCPAGMEMFAKALYSRLREALETKTYIPTPNSQRPVLILLDRNVDISSMLSHSWTYQSLIHDLLGLELNRVKVEVKDTDKNTSSLQSYDLESGDSFWNQHRGSPFEQVAQDVNKKLHEWTEEREAITKKRDDTEDDDKVSGQQMMDQTRDLGSLVSSLPELRNKKKMIDTHTNILTALLGKITERELNLFVSLEESMIRFSVDEKKLATQLQDGKGTPEDKLRLFLLYYLSASSPSKTILDLAETLIDSKTDDSLINYCKKLKQFCGFEKIAPTSRNLPNNPTALLEKFSFSSLSGIMQAGVNYLTSSSSELVISRMVDAVMESKSSFGVENYLYLDPRDRNITTAPPRKTFTDAIVVVLGGGNYLEYQNLQDYAKRQQQQKKTGVNIIYGATEVLNASQFLEQLRSVASATEGSRPQRA
eukprot:TRINITY_DN13097_c0_g1_i1.p1 TRINITY_DN13097_c0_g1~~TRINITY_DN13097_c0_g1_i1.p1  ORF type:complete len:616 (+),score=111.30 TRINITY_DN13097_c0_g1_i1:69-1916(+)